MRGDGGQEAQVGHVVGLVEHGDLDVVERAGALLDQVDQPARRGDDDVDAAAEPLDLLADGRAAEDGRDPQPERRSSGSSASATCSASSRVGHQDQAARRLRARAAALASEPGQHRQAEGEGLAGAGLRAAEHVAAGERVGQRRGLDRERRD